MSEIESTDLTDTRETFHKVADFLSTLIRLFPLQAPDFMSTHYREAPLDTPIEPVIDWPE